MNITLINFGFLFYFISFFISILYIVLKKDIIEKVFINLFLIGVIFNIISIVVRWMEAGRAPLSNSYETMIFFAACFGLSYYVVRYFYKSKILHFICSLFILLVTAYSTLYTDTSIRPLMPALKSNWLIIHVASYMLSYGIISISFLVSCIIIFQAILKKGYFDSERKEQNSGLVTINYKLISIAFPLLTLGLVTGAVWAKKAWGDYWSWDPKETWSLICWFFYINYLHLPFSIKKLFKLNKNQIMIIESIILTIGFFLVMFTYLGLKYLPAAEQSMHLYK